MRILVARLLSALMLGGASLPALLPEEPPSGGSSLSTVSESSSIAASESVANSLSHAESAPASLSSAESHGESSTESAPASSLTSSSPPQSSSAPGSVPSEAASGSVSTSAPSSEVTALSDEENEAETEPVILSQEYAGLLATTQADSMMGFYGLTRSEACTSVEAVFPLAEYAAETEDAAYTALWDAMNMALEKLAASGAEKAHCVFEEGGITILKA